MPLPLLSSPLPAILGHRACVYKRVQLSCNKKELLLEIKTIGVFLHFFPSALGRLVVREVIFENKIMEVTHASNKVCSCCIFSSSCLYCRREILSWETCLLHSSPGRGRSKEPLSRKAFSVPLLAFSSLPLPESCRCACAFSRAHDKRGPLATDLHISDRQMNIPQNLETCCCKNYSYKRVQLGSVKINEVFPLRGNALAMPLVVRGQFPVLISVRPSSP